MAEDSLDEEVGRITREAGAESMAVSLHDYASGTAISLDGEAWYHAASTIKVPILVGVWGAIAQGRFDAESRVHVRNRFRGATDGMPYAVDAARDADADVHAAIGKTMHVRDLARHMIITSSNLATNVLLDLVGVKSVQETLEELGITGVRVRRGVEDERAWEQGLNNEVTADGLRDLFRLLVEGRAFSREASDEMLAILHDQQFRSGIPAGLPDGTKVAHKTGEISTAAHDAGVVFPDGAEPYVLAVLTRWPGDTDASRRRELIAAVSRAVHERFGHREADGGDD